MIRFSPKRNVAFDKIKVENPAEDESGPSHGIRSFCPTKWTVRGDAIESIIDNYDTPKCLETKLKTDVRGRIIGVQTQMLHYTTLFVLQLSKKILHITDNLSHILQHQAMSAAEGQAVELTVSTLKGMHTEESFALFFNLIERFHRATSTDPPVLPCKRRAPERYEIGSGEAYHSATVGDHYHRQYWILLSLAL